jgi:hypothetical protein
VSSLSALIAQALEPTHGDPAFQALLLAQQEPAVAEYLALAAQEAADRRRVRGAIDAFAHPGKLRRQPDGVPGPLLQLRACAQAGDWPGVRAAAHALAGTGWQPRSEPLLAESGLARLEHASLLRAKPAIKRYLGLSAARGPLAQSADAAEHGRAAARAGDAAEEETVRVFRQLAAWLDATGPARHRVARSLRPSSGLPRAAHGAKDEWDVALLRTVEGTDVLALVLLAEVKASPGAAVSDWPRMRRGLHGLAQLSAGAQPVFACLDGEVRVHGDSLRALAPSGRGLPPQVIYCCTGHEARVPLLSTPARAMLLQQPSSIAYAGALDRGATADAGVLAPLWEALPTSPRLRPILEQYETARSAREVMLHPEDLRASAAARFSASQALGVRRT